MSHNPGYPVPIGVSVVPEHLLDLRSDVEIDDDLIHSWPITSEKNVWFFWHNGYENMHPYTKRNIRAWHRRFSPAGWRIRVLNRVPSSPLSVESFLDTSDPETFPRAFIDGLIGGDYAPQHTSDLVRFPLLLKYGGVYADVGLMQIGDLDRLWSETIENPHSRFEVLSYNCGDVSERSLANYFLVAKKNNPMFARCQRLFLALWAENGGKASTDGMHASPLLKGVPMLGQALSWEESGQVIDKEQGSKLLTDYIIQGQVISMVMGLVDEEDDWHGPRYVAKHLYGIDYMVGSQLINEMTAWDGRRAFELMSLPVPKDGEVETPDQKHARNIVEACLQQSFGFKLAHGLILRVFGETLGSLWRKHEGSDNVPRTYAHWLRHGMIYWCQESLPPTQEFTVIEPFKVGRLLGERAGH